MEPEPDGRLRTGFSTGTAMTAAARAALLRLLTGAAPPVTAVELPAGIYYPVAVRSCRADRGLATAVVEKDGGDDPDVTHKALIQVQLRLLDLSSPLRPAHPDCAGPGILLVGGTGVGRVTKPGLPVVPGEPAINPVPRQMLITNLVRILNGCHAAGANPGSGPASGSDPEGSALAPGPASQPTALGVNRVLLAWPPTAGSWAARTRLELVVTVPAGAALAGRTLNPRLGIVGGISILGTTGLVKPFSHEAYEDTIATALRVAAAGGCREVVLSTGGKSEKLAQRLLPDRSPEAFVQIADFFAVAVTRSVQMGFDHIVHSVFFGKAVKMAAGHAYTHAHRVPLELGPVLAAARKFGCPRAFRDQLASANTARHALEMLLAREARQVIEDVARAAALQSAELTGNRVPIRLLLFDYDGRLLADVRASE